MCLARLTGARAALSCSDGDADAADDEDDGVVFAVDDSLDLCLRLITSAWSS